LLEVYLGNGRYLRDDALGRAFFLHHLERLLWRLRRCRVDGAGRIRLLSSICAVTLGLRGLVVCRFIEREIGTY
jgi:hypothetical protein